MKLRLTKNVARLFILGAALMFTQVKIGYAQLAGNVYTPYTAHGIGVLDIQGNSATKQMGGIGAAFRSSIFQNNVNPASYSAVPQKTFLMSLGMQGTSNYLKSETATSSHNGLTLGDFGALFPLTKGVGLGVSITPQTSVGYHTEATETPDPVLTDIGYLSQAYTGSGNIVQYKVGVGAKLLKGLSVGANIAYYHGFISRQSSLAVIPSISTGVFRTITNVDQRAYSYLGADIGLQYSVPLNEEKARFLNFGAVYQPKINSKIDQEVSVSSIGTIITDSVSYKAGESDYTMPSKITLGFLYASRSLEVGVDYVRQDWTDAFETDPLSNVELQTYEDIRFGMQYTPNRFDIRNAMKRWTYRLGFRYGSSYMALNDKDLTDYSVTFGVGIPLETGSFTLLNVGGEIGKTGLVAPGQVRDLYVKLHLGVTLFGHSEWFTRYKFK